MKTITLIVTLLISNGLLAFNFASPSEPSGKLILNHSINAKQLFPVRLLMVDDENVNVRSDAVWLTPGEYKLRFATTINEDYTKKIMGLKERRGLKSLKNTMTIKIESNRTYYVAYDASSTETSDWQPVIYKIK